MLVKQIMTKRIEMINAAAPLTEASKKMKSLNVGVLPVKEGNKIVGILTDRDIVVRALAEDKDPSDTPVSDIMSHEIQCCLADDFVEEAASMMQSRQLRRLLVIDQDNIPVGIISLGDIAAKLEVDQLTGEILEEISRPPGPTR